MAKFEDNLGALETVVEQLERGDLSLEDSVKLFEKGVALSAACKSELDSADGKIQMLLDQGSGSTVDLPVERESVVDTDDED